MHRAVPTITESADELTTLLKAEQNVTRAQRRQMPYLCAGRQVKTRKEAAAILGVNRAPIGAWLAQDAAGGRDAARDRDVAAGKPSHPPLAVAAAVRAARAAPTGFASSGAMVDGRWPQPGMRRASSTVHTPVRDTLTAQPNVGWRSNRKKRAPSRPSKPRSSNASALPFPPTTASP